MMRRIFRRLFSGTPAVCLGLAVGLGSLAVVSYPAWPRRAWPRQQIDEFLYVPPESPEHRLSRHLWPTKYEDLLAPDQIAEIERAKAASGHAYDE